MKRRDPLLVIGEKIDRLINDRANGYVDEPTFKRELKALEARESRLEQRAKPEHRGRA